MDTVIFVETLDAQGQVVHRQRFDVLPVLVGRSYANDVILDDRFVSPEHARIERTPEGSLVMEDLNTTNGTFVGRERHRRSEITLWPGVEVRVGRTVLRIATLNQPILETIREARGWKRMLAAADRPVVALAVVLVALLVLVVPEALSTTEPEWFGESLVLAFGIGILFAFWAGAWAIVNRMVAHRFRFGQHLALTAVVGTAMALVVGVLEYREFIFSPSELATTVEFGLEAMLLIALFYGHLTILERMRPARRGVIAASIAVVLTIVTGQLVSSDDFSSELEITTTLKPVGVGLLSTVDVDAFLEGTIEVRELVDELAVDDDR